MSESPAAPLIRLGYYSVEEKPGANAVGPAVGGTALADYWRELIAYCVGTTERRAAAASAIDQANAAGNPDAAQAVRRWRYGQKIEIKSAEAVAALLHAIVAPDAPFLCDERCAHVEGGASAEQVKRFLDSVDAAVLECRRRWRLDRVGSTVGEDLQDEFGMYERWRGKLVERCAPGQGG